MDIGNLLDCITEYDEQIEGYYKKVRDLSENNEARFLTYFLRKSQYHLLQVVGRFSDVERECIRKVQINCDVKNFSEKRLRIIQALPVDVTERALLEMAIQYSEELLGVCKDVFAQRVPESAKRLFKEFINVKEKDVVMLRKMILLHCRGCSISETPAEQN